MKRASKLKDYERSEIQILKNKGYSIRSIAKALGRSPNTISYELKHNSMQKTGDYLAIKARHKAYVRKKYARFEWNKINKEDSLRLIITTKLKDHWNPAEISGFLEVHQSCSIEGCRSPDLGAGCSRGLPYVSKTTIYDWLRTSYGQRYCQYLYSKRYNKKPRKENKTKKMMIPGRISITERPIDLELRIEPGHLEFDSIVSSKRSGSKYALAVVQDRTTRLVRAKLVPNLKPASYSKVILSLVKDLKTLSLTTDNGIENKNHQQITLSLNTKPPVYFTDPYSSWQKGGVENANKMLRRYFPKGTDFSTIRQTDVDEALVRINNKPRKILGFKSSLQVAIEKGLFKETERTVVKG